MHARGLSSIPSVVATYLAALFLQCNEPMSFSNFCKRLKRDETLVERQMRQHIQFLADDSLKGRQPGTFGEEIAAAFVASQMEEIGCLPAGEDGTYFQTIKMVGMTAKSSASRLAFKVQEFQLTGKFGDDYVHSMDPTGDDAFASFENLDLVFVGHGVTALELNWDDFKGQDLTGKIMLVIVNQPQVEPFPGQDMLYYGRWTYKFEEARRRGAAGCLIIFSEELAGYPWSVTRTGYTGEKVSLAKEETNPLALHGWINRETGQKLAQAYGTTLETWLSAAKDPKFQPFTVGSVSHAAEYDLRHFQGRNVLGLIPGRSEKHCQEVIVVAGHHDHLGERQGEIYNGAVDNCTGVATFRSISKHFQILYFHSIDLCILCYCLILLCISLFYIV